MSLYNRLIQELSRKSRLQKFDLFKAVFKPQPNDLVLDIGATGSYFPLRTFEDFYPYSERIVGGGIALEEVKTAKQIYPFSNYVTFDGCDLPFRDKSFDIVFSNAVIEHVLDKGRQAQFAREVMRVGKSWFVTTPNYWFPFDSYSYLLFLQFLPRSMQRRYKQLLAGVAGGQTLDVALLSARRLQSLFPTSSITRIRVTLWPETLVAYFVDPSRDRPHVRIRNLGNGRLADCKVGFSTEH